MLTGVRLALAALVVAAACVATPEPSPSSSPSQAQTVQNIQDMTDALAKNPLPVADLFDLTKRLRGRDGTPAAAFTAARQAPPDEGVGSLAQFWTYDFDAKKNVKVSATLRVLTGHSKWWVADGVTVDMQALQTTATTFETKIYPADTAAYGSEWTPGIDSDPRIDILIARIPGRAAGYFSSADELPVWINEFSAEREMIYVNSATSRLASDGIYSVLAHEFCHMIQFNKKTRSIVWFNEGQAQLCERFAGPPGNFDQQFLRQPDTQLNDWSDLDTATLHYGAALLFLEFLREHAGGDELINALLAHGIDTPLDVDAVLKARGQPGMDEQYADFVAANALIGASPDPKYAYAGNRLTAAAPTAQDRAAAGADLRSTVHEYAARYVALPQTPVHVKFSGPTTQRIIPADAHSGHMTWWSDRIDGLDSTLTRTVDLSTATKATLSFWSWFDVEPDFDYAYVAVSTDGGQKWTTLKTDATTADDPNGNNLGNGMTGKSGGGAKAAWVKQSADLSPYAGKKVQLRFEYVTDAALNFDGFALDDVTIPEIGFTDDAEKDNGWTATGFIRSSNVVKQRYVVQVIRFGATSTVERHVVEDGALEIDVDGSTDRKAPVLAVTPLAPRSTQAVAFTVSVGPKQ